MNLALYTRISEDPTGTSDAPLRQEEACRAWAERNGHTIVKVYEDRDISAYKNVPRPGFMAMLEDRSIEGIVCWRIDRLIRNWRDWAKLDTLIDNGTVLFTEDGTDSRRDSLAITIKVGFAKEESRKISERVRNKAAFLARSGDPPRGGMRAYGYTRDWEIIEEEAKEIRWAAAQLLAGGSMRPITDEWNRRGVPTVMGKEWNPSNLRMMLKRPHLAGFRGYQGNVYPGTWPPILSESQHKGLQRLFASRAREKPIRKHFASGLFVCALCAKHLGADGAKYKCPCGKVTILIRHTERFVEEVIEEFSQRIPTEVHAPDYTSEIEAIELAIRNLDDAHFIEQAIDKFSHRRLRNQLEEKLKGLVVETPRLPTGAFVEWWPVLSLGERALIARKIIQCVRVSPPGRGRRGFYAAIFALELR